jgi:hypothetical protein
MRAAKDFQRSHLCRKNKQLDKQISFLSRRFIQAKNKHSLDGGPDRIPRPNVPLLSTSRELEPLSFDASVQDNFS